MKKAIIVILLSAFILGAGGVYAVYMGYLKPNDIYIRKHDIIGCDVSHYQGEIDWKTVSGQNIKFAFIKATEGSGHVDAMFHRNWDEVFKTNIKAGAYHFFSFESPGSSQAKNFIETVGRRKGMLPPVVDIEFYAGNEKNKPDPSQVREQLNYYVAAIEQEYQTKPIIYTTPRAYEFFIEGYYEGYPLWVRSVLTKPKPDREWTFWQYTNRGRLKGYAGTEPYIDLNVFHGDEEQLGQLLIR